MTFRDTTSVFERLVSNMEVGEKPSNPEIGAPDTPCWTWQKGVDNKGYGYFYVYDATVPSTGKRKRGGKSRTLRAHIASWTLANGPVPHAMTLDHLCRNKGCIRPSHLECVSNPENVRRMHRAHKIHRAKSTAVLFPSEAA